MATTSETVNRVSVARRGSRIVTVTAIISAPHGQAIENLLPPMSGNAGNVSLKNTGTTRINPTRRAMRTASTAGDITLNLDTEIRQIGGFSTVLRRRRVRQPTMSVPRTCVVTVVRSPRTVNTLAIKMVRLLFPPVVVTEWLAMAVSFTR